MLSSPGSPWVVPLRPHPDAALRLFCFPPAGSGTAAYRAWVPLAGRDLALHAILPPGRETRFPEAPLDDFPTVVEQAAAAILPFAHQRYALFGHSLGSLVAYEVARRLTARGAGPEALFVSGHQAPQVGSHRAPIAHLPDAGFLRGLIALGGTPPEILDAPELLALLLPMLRADFALAETYRPLPGPKLHCPVTALGGRDDPWVTEAGLDAWRGVSSGRFERAMLPGDHFYIAPARALILARIQDQLAGCLAAA